MKVKLLNSCFGGTRQSFLFYMVLALIVLLLAVLLMGLYRKGEQVRNKFHTNPVEQNVVTPVTPVNSFGSLEHILDFTATNQINAYLTEDYFGESWVIRGFNVKPWVTVVYYPNYLTVDPIMFPMRNTISLADEFDVKSIPVRISMKLLGGSVLWQPAHIETYSPRNTLFVSVSTNQLRALKARILKKG